MYKTLISVKDLAARILPAHGAAQTDDWLVIDCRFDLSNPDAGERAWQAGHIPGALYAHLDRDLAAPVTALTGRHPLPAPHEFADTLGRWGLTPQTRVIAYDADNGMYASRLWWLLRWVGHEAVAVLDGGFKLWQQDGLPVSVEIPQRQATTVADRANDNLIVTAQQVSALVQQADWRVLDARAAERFSGTIEPLDSVAGHIPGARNHPFATSMSDGRFLPAATLRERFERSQQGVTNDHTIAMCGSGVTACHLLLAMEYAGMRGARLYPGSWSEWIRDPARPVASG
jgi:thiosulfate/3-mercaptopyruvate sulfurtransferase